MDEVMDDGKQDILIVPDAQGVIELSVVGKAADCGLLLLQRLYVLLLSDMTSQYRGSPVGYSLLALLEGGNMPTDAMLTSMLGVPSAAALSSLDASDKALIESFSAVGESGHILCTLTLKDGTVVTGATK